MLKLDRHVPTPGVPEFNRRFVYLLILVGVAFLVLFGRLWQLQIIRGERYFQTSTNNFIKEQWIDAKRGEIQDRNGEPLADNRPAFNVYVTPRYFTEDGERKLGQLMGLNRTQKESLHERVAQVKGRDRYRAMRVFEDVTPDQMTILEQAKAELPGIDVMALQHRRYPNGALAAHILGYMNQISGSELETRRAEGYEEGDYVGRYGIERQWENYLRGTKGVERFVVDARGQRKSEKEAEELIAAERSVPPENGRNVRLTFDIKMQRLAERALRHHPAGGVAVIEVHTGRILALVSKPAFDPNVMTGHLTRRQEAEMEADPYKPFIDKTLRQHYYPGSTFKFVTALAALKYGLITPDTRVTCPGFHELGKHTFRCTKVHGTMDLYTAMSQSCNVYFWTVAERVGLDRIAEMAREFGFGSPSGVGLNGDVPGRVPWKEWYEKNRGGFRIGYTLNTAIGQGDTEATVLQLALAYAAVANGGDLWIPQLVLRVETEDGKLVGEYPPVLRRHIDLPPGALENVRKGLWGGVNDPLGTAHSARIELPIEIAGKTGTAQVRKLQKQPDKREGWHPYRDHAWFAGYAPSEKPEIAIVVLVEHGGKGGHVAAPVAMEIVRGYFESIKEGNEAEPRDPANLPVLPDEIPDHVYDPEEDEP